MNSLAIEKVGNGYILYINYPVLNNNRHNPGEPEVSIRMVFSSTISLNKYLVENFSLDV